MGEDSEIKCQSLVLTVMVGRREEAESRGRYISETSEDSPWKSFPWLSRSLSSDLLVGVGV